MKGDNITAAKAEHECAKAWQRQAFTLCRTGIGGGEIIDRRLDGG